MNAKDKKTVSYGQYYGKSLIYEFKTNKPPGEIPIDPNKPMAGILQLVKTYKKPPTTPYKWKYPKVYVSVVPRLGGGYRIKTTYMGKEIFNLSGNRIYKTKNAGLQAAKSLISGISAIDFILK